MKHLIYSVFAFMIFVNFTTVYSQTNKSLQSNEKTKTTTLSNGKKVKLVINYPEIMDISERIYKKHVTFMIDKGSDEAKYNIVLSVDGVKREYILDNRIEQIFSFNDSLRIVSSTFKYMLKDERGILKKIKN